MEEDLAVGEAVGEPGWLRRCIDGEEAAWRDLLERYHGFVSAVVRRIFERRALPHGRGEVEEIARDLFADLCLRRQELLGGFRGTGPFRAWLAVLAANYARRRADALCRERLNLERHRERLVAEEETRSKQDPAGDAPVDSVARAVGRCTAQERLLFQVLYVDALQAEEAATLLGITREALYLRKHRFHLRIREILAVMKDRGGEMDLHAGLLRAQPGETDVTEGSG